MNNSEMVFGKALTQASADDLLKEMVQRILSVGKPQKIVLFGSRAHGNAQPDSDYDLLVIESSKLPRYKRATKYRQALTSIGRAKDIVVWTPGEVAEWRNVPNAFITTILNEGIVLYEG